MSGSSIYQNFYCQRVCIINDFCLTFSCIGEKPSHWDKMPMDPSTGKERPLHVVDLNPQNQEYQDMKKMFDATMQQNVSSTTATPAHPHVQSPNAMATYVTSGFGTGLAGNMYNTIVKIQRIQNPALYFQYIARKKEMDKLNPQGHKNERQLFHGTKPDTCSQINHGGFNRSYCGQNGKHYYSSYYCSYNVMYIIIIVALTINNIRMVYTCSLLFVLSYSI